MITKIKYNDYHFLVQQKNVKIDNFQNVYLHALNCIGITTIQAYPQKIENGYIFWCKIIINLNRVANSGKQTPFPFVVNDNNIYKLKENFSELVLTFSSELRIISLETVPRVASGVWIKACSFIGVARFLFFMPTYSV